ncbi:hypothetical protein ALC56_10533 [Trachymyrmex septentrionalis]|uniref:Uncharacterized protein n=1 Tax=Trachymyrmex septentrionalis TaxID=34720 RepID=A0A195F4G7_9HYME|nr:hypothetical protein ALC56_10533 [Trachymyrmex septentrionalis]
MGDCAGGCKMVPEVTLCRQSPLPLPSTTRDWTTSLMESSFFSRKMFIGGLSWQTSPDLTTADNPMSKRVFRLLVSSVLRIVTARDGERGFEYVCTGSRSHGRRTLLSASISFCRLADLEQEAPCADMRTLESIS